MLLLALGLATAAYAAKLPQIAAAVLVLTGLSTWVYYSPRFYAWRYILPGLLAALLFIVLPMSYTLFIGLTNYSSANLLSFERATEVLLSKTNSTGDSYAMRILEQGSQKQLLLISEDDRHWVSAPVVFTAGMNLAMQAVTDTAERDRLLEKPSLPLKEVIAAQPILKQMVAFLPDGTQLRPTSLTRFAAKRPAYTRLNNGYLQDSADGTVLQPDFKTGYWRKTNGDVVEPGFRTYVGLDNYIRIFTDQRFFEPFVRVFVWTVTFTTLNTVLTFALGLVLAVLLNWEALRGRTFYRIMLFLPFAVPAFISIPVFRGLFNENLGEVNMVLDALFGIRPGWFSDATLARSLILIVNTWLGFPYMMILCMGLIKAIPSELYEASALAGAGPLTNFFSITLPLIFKPIAPLLIASFAANFNNLTLIALLTGGLPDYLDTQVPVGATDLLASYTYRIAFQDSGQNYALACAISSVVFVLIAALAMVNLRLFKVGQESK